MWFHWFFFIFFIIIFIVFGTLFISQMYPIYLLWRAFGSPQEPIIKWVHTLFAPNVLSSFVCAPFLQHPRYEKWMSLSIYSAIHFSRGLYHWSWSSPITRFFHPLASPSLEQMSVPFSVPNKSVINDINQQRSQTTAARKQQVQASAATAPRALVQYCSLVARSGTDKHI